MSARAAAAGAGLDPAALVRSELRELPLYTLDLDPCPWKLDQNESPWDPPRRVRERVAARLVAEPWARYPDFHADELRARLGALHGWPAEGVLLGNGSNELLALVLQAVVRPGQEVLGAEPSFGLYRGMVLAAGGRPAFLPPREDLRLPVAELARRVEEDPERPVLLCSPNNPTGDAATPDDLAGLLSRLAGPLLLDNAYGEMSRFDYRPLLARFPNLVLFRTLSKAWALGGIRVGYLLADPRLVAELLKVKLPYNLGRAAQAAAGETLADERSMRRRVAVLRGRRGQWAAMLARHGLEPLPSEANFILVRCGAGRAGEERRRAVVAGLAARGIRVRDVSRGPGLAACFRISVADGRALRAVDAALAEVVADLAAAGPVVGVTP